MVGHLTPGASSGLEPSSGGAARAASSQKGPGTDLEPPLGQGRVSWEHFWASWVTKGSKATKVVLLSQSPGGEMAKETQNFTSQQSQL